MLSARTSVNYKKVVQIEINRVNVMYNKYCKFVTMSSLIPDVITGEETRHYRQV